MENKRDEELMERSSECSESQGNGAAPNGTAWSPLAVIGCSGREGMMEGKEHLEDELGELQIGDTIDDREQREARARGCESGSRVWCVSSSARV
jgi:hypothetical protein